MYSLMIFLCQNWKYIEFLALHQITSPLKISLFGGDYLMYFLKFGYFILYFGSLSMRSLPVHMVILWYCCSNKNTMTAG